MNRRFAVALIGGGALFQVAALAGLIGSTELAARPAYGTAVQFPSDNGDILVHSVQQMSVVIETREGVIYTDPTGGAAHYAGYRKPDIILISHEHGEHFDVQTLEELAGPESRIVIPPYVMEQIPENLRSRVVSLANSPSGSTPTA